MNNAQRAIASACAQTLGPAKGKCDYRTVIGEYPNHDTVQQAVYGNVIKYWACHNHINARPVEFDTEAMAIAYLYRGTF